MIVDEGYKESAGFSVCRDHRAFGSLTRLVHAGEQSRRRRLAGICVLDNSIQVSLESEIQGRIDSDCVGPWDLRVAPDEVGQVTFGDSDLAEGQKVPLPNRECKLAYRSTESVSELLVWHFERVNAEAVTIEPGDGVLIGANQRILHVPVLADDLLERLEVAMCTGGVIRCSLTTET